MNIQKIFAEHIDLDYKKFHEKLCHTSYKILGIKIPILRKITKELLQKYDYQVILNNLNNNYYEYVMVKGFVIATANINYEERIILIKNYLDLIDNWAICDTFCSLLKFIKKHKKEFLNFLKDLDKTKEFYYRFYLVILLDYYIDDEYLNFVLNENLNIVSQYYYVKMASSWCLSTCLIKYYDKTKEFLVNNKNNIDPWIYNKALQKAIESYRISKECKIVLRKMKI